MLENVLSATDVNLTRQHFGLTLVVNHACNLRCTYCYTGAKFSSPMPLQFGVTAITRAFRSLAPDGRLDLGFFGGEPLLEASRIREWVAYARTWCGRTGQTLQMNLTTNGTIESDEAREIMHAADVDLTISFDASPEIHNRHRRDTKGNPTAALVEKTMRRLIDIGKAFTVVAVVRPDNLEQLSEGLEYLYHLGIRQVHLSLDLWTTWTTSDGPRLQDFVSRAARLWRQWLPNFSLNWFDGKGGALAQVPASEETTRCRFGDGEIAVAPSGRLYPCERVVGDDRADNPLRLFGHVLDDADFLSPDVRAFSRCAPCSSCALAAACDTTCRCSNFIRTGDVNRPDGLLCLLNKATARAVAAAFQTSSLTDQSDKYAARKEECYV